MLSYFSTDIVLWAHLTNPLTNEKHFNEAIEIFKKLNKKKYDSLFSATKVIDYFWDQNKKPINHNPLEKIHTILSTGKIRPLYTDNGSIFIRKHKDMIKDGDALFLQDYWHPGIESILYALDLYGISVEIYAMLHAQSVDEYDFTYNMKNWMRHYELGLDERLSGIFVGTALAAYYGATNVTIFILALCTTIGLQVTSNFANDYGDGVKGTDGDDRIGPKRALQSGLLTAAELKRGIYISIVINAVLIISLIFISFGIKDVLYPVLFLVLGALAIWAAIKYTVGKSAYGYQGLGDVFVFIFSDW